MSVHAAPAPDEVTVPLSTGTLRLNVHEHKAGWPLERLCGFATRRNPRRGFLIVSKVLGRHLPSRPADMRSAARALAEGASAMVRGPALVVGLAETAIALGQTVFAELLRLGNQAAFVQSTRQRVPHPLLCRFEEPHSHASAHLVYRPVNMELARIKTLVLVDDEISTGSTLRNLAAALTPSLPGCRNIIVATLTDWGDGSEWLDHMPHGSSIISLLRGRLQWTPKGETAAGDPAFDRFTEALGELSEGGPFGRLGASEAIPFDIPDIPSLKPPLPVRVIGTGEFTYPPFLLAERLELEGRDVVVQATSRSPAHLGGAIASALRFRDNYGTAIPNFLYNAEAADGRLSLICHETPPGSIDPALMAALGARVLFFGDARFR